MVPDEDASEDGKDGIRDTLVVAVFRVGDVLRLHSLLCGYESPFVTDAEAGVRRADLTDVERLRRYVRSLLAVPADEQVD